MQLRSDEIIERLKEKIPKISNIDPSIFGILHLDIVSEDKKNIKQLVLMIERCKVFEPKQFLRESQIFADVYIKIEDRILYQLAVKEISIDDALKTIEFYGDDEIWKYQLDALRNILPNEHFEVKKEKKSEEDVIIDVMPIKEEEVTKIPDEFQFLADAFIKLNKT